jgi:hypothetical protein
MRSARHCSSLMGEMQSQPSNDGVFFVEVMLLMISGLRFFF